MRAAAGIWFGGWLTEGGFSQAICQLEDGLVRRVFHFGAHLHRAGHVLFGHSELLAFVVMILEARFAVGRDGRAHGHQFIQGRGADAGRILGQPNPGRQFMAFRVTPNGRNTTAGKDHRQGRLTPVRESLFHLLVLDECRGAWDRLNRCTFTPWSCSHFRSAANRINTGSTSGPQAPVEQHVAGS